VPPVTVLIVKRHLNQFFFNNNNNSDSYTQELKQLSMQYAGW